MLHWFGETGHPRAALPWQSSNLAIANEAQRTTAPSLGVAWIKVLGSCPSPEFITISAQILEA